MQYLAAGTSHAQLASLCISTQINAGNYHILMTISTENGVSKKVIGKYKYNNKIQIVGPEYFILDNRLGGNVTQTPQIDKCIPKTDFAKTIFNLEKKGSVILKFGDGHGPKLLILAGIHGNETAANIAIMKYLEYIKDKKIHGTLYIIPFAIPVDTALNTRFYNGVDPNRIADVKGSPA
ncbi:MAG: succinylglutamate desuccinylase/aspartoacylase family protein [Methanobacterium sp.]|nr:succinylglutamate desuccinylase/aspartoacylase family protein [Methanobacterium sp.]